MEVAPHEHLPEAVLPEGFSEVEPRAVLAEAPQAVLAEGFLEGEAEELKHEDPALELEQVEPALDSEDFALSEESAVDCQKKLARLGDLNTQDLSGHVGNDPLFPPEESSIAAPGVECGDSAQGIKESCSKFNHWKTFQTVSTQLGRPYKIIGAQGVSFDDINQGALGNCYFLAALASVVSQNPKIIENMFVDRHLWSEGIFKTKWLLQGKESIVSVDNMIPAGDTDTYFTHGSPTGEWWPVVLSKTWAKIFGSFKAVEGGVSSRVVSAITRAPSYSYKTADKTDKEIWELLVGCKTQKYPVYAGTGKVTSFGLASGHAYAVLDAFEDANYGKVVKCYNPWGKDNYVGGIPNTVAVNGPKPGVFTMKLHEFTKAFESFSYNVVAFGYKATDLSGVPAGRAAFDVSVSAPGKFWISFAWPLERMMEGCPRPDTTKTTLLAQLTTEPGKMLGTPLKEFLGAGTKAFEFPGTTAGTYNLIKNLIFTKESSKYLSKHAISVYAPGTVTISRSTKSAEQVYLEMFGPLDDMDRPCNIITSASGTFYLDQTKIIKGAPTYWSSDKKEFVYYQGPRWAVISADYWDKVVAGALWSSKKYLKTDFKCGAPPCADNPGGVPIFNPPIPCSTATGPGGYSNVKCTGVQYSSAVQKYCPASCGLCSK
jgi:hypothetical protein